MGDRTFWLRPAARRAAIGAAALALAIALPREAGAQYNAPPLSSVAIGERYHVELSGTIWNPALVGTVSSEQFGQAGTDLDFVTDLGFEQTRFKDLRLVVRPARKHRLKVQYTPIAYLASTTLHRDVVFNGQKFLVALPISTEFAWKVLRFGYEYDIGYWDRGFVGVLVEGRYTQFDASLQNPLSIEFTSAKAPLPALGFVGRAYVAPSVAVNFEVSGFQLPEGLSATTKANYYDWDIYGTVNLANNFGVQVGWRRMTTLLTVDKDKADFKFQGVWFGAALRY